MSVTTVGFKIQAFDAFSTVFDKLEDKTKSVEDMGKKFDKVGGTLTKWVSGPLAAVGAGAFALATKVGNTADRILDLHDITGLTTDSLQEWQHVAKIAGVEVESIAHATEGLIRRLPALQDENGKATEGMEKLGLSFKELEKLTPDEMIDTLMYSLSAMEDPLERNAIGSQLFGGEWKNLAPILGMGEDAIKDLRGEAHVLGGVMDGDALNAANEFRQTMVRLQTQAMSLFNEIGSKLAPILTDVLVPAFQDHVAPALAKVGDLIVKLIEWFGNLSPTTQKTILMVIALVAAIGPAVAIIGKLIAAAKIVAVVIAAITSPIGLVVLAISSVILAGVLLYKHWDVVKAKASELWQKIKDIFEKIKTVVTDKINDAKTSVTDTFNSMVSFVTGLGSTFYNAGKGLIDQMVNGIKNAASRAIQAVKDIAQSVRNLLPFSPAKDGSMRKGDAVSKKNATDCVQLIAKIKAVNVIIAIKPLAVAV